MEETTQGFVAKITTAQAQLAELWSRVGLSPEEQQSKWTAFIAGSLESFLGNFKQLCYSEEKQLLVQNDEALREMVTLAANLKTMPQNAQLVDVIRAVLEPTSAASSLGSPLVGIEDARKMLPSFAKLHATETSGDKEVQDGTSDAAVAEALRRLCASRPTHRQMYQLLTDELKRLNDTASIRLAMLRLLHKQRALLQLSPEEQVALRTAYAHKYITQCTPITVWATPAKENAKLEDGTSATAQRLSSQFGSARSTDTDEAGVVVNDPTNPDFNELQLLMTASLYNDVNSTRDTSFCLQPRPTCISATPLPVTDRPCATPEAPAVARNLQADVCDVDQTRVSLFEPDLSDVDRYGKRQDLSMDRIRDEAGAILREVEQQNEVMQRQTESDLQCVEAAVARWPGSPSASQPSRHAMLDKMKAEVARLQDAFDKSLATAAAARTHERSALDGLPQSSSHGNVAARVSVEDQHQLAEALPSSAAVTAQCAVPTCIRQLLATSSFAPIRACASQYRDALVREILRDHRDRTRACHDELCEVARRYAAATTAAYAVPQTTATATDGTEPIGIPSALARQYDVAMAAVDANCADATADDANSGARQVSSGIIITTVQQLQQSVDGLDRVCEALKSTSLVLHQRLSLLEQGAALVEKRNSILEEKQHMQEGSRERLLSKKINMAKVLLHEENVRRRMAKELPAAMRQLATLAEEWARLNQRNEGDDGSRTHGEVVSSSSSSSAVAPWAGPFVVHGVDVAELLRQHADNPEGITSSTAMTAMRTASTSRALSSGAVRSVSRPRAPGTVENHSAGVNGGLKRQRPSPVRSARSSTPQPPSLPAEPGVPRRRLASPALRPHGVNVATARVGKPASHSISPPPRGGSPVPSVFARLQSTRSNSRAAKTTEPS